MGVASKYNTSNLLFTAQVPDSIGYAKLSELVQAHGLKEKYIVRAIYINNKGKFGAQPAILTDEAIVNMPSHLLSVCEDMRRDEETVAAINAGKFAFKIYEYEGKNGKGYSVEWLDV